ncbi:MAG: nuclear transport factor 2 family protein [Lapillicoccus sp.]
MLPTPETEAAIAALADRLQDAIVSGDVGAAQGIYADDLVVWHNYDRVDCDKATSVAAIASMATSYRSLTVSDVRRDYLADGYVQRSVFHATSLDGGTDEVDAMMRVWVREGRVTRIEEYTDTAATPPPARVAQVRG